MAPVSIVDVCNNVISDILNNAGLAPPKQIYRYSQPRVIPPDSNPALAVWCEDTSYRLEVAGLNSLDAYERMHALGVAWYVHNTNEAETGGTGDADTVHDLETVRAALEARCAAWTNGVPGFGNQVIATLTRCTIEPTEGVTWRCYLTVTIEECA